MMDLNNVELQVHFRRAARHCLLRCTSLWPPFVELW